LNDPKLNFYGNGTRYGLFAIGAFLCVALILILIAQYQNGVWNNPAVVSGPPMRVMIAPLILIVLVFISHGALLRRLRNHHSDVWDQLGQPSLFLNNTISNNFRVTGFVWSGKFLKLHDARLSCYAVSDIVLTVIFFGLFVLR
jgi:hypothetical protein